jgi:hypothetical protein
VKSLRPTAVAAALVIAAACSQPAASPPVAAVSVKLNKSAVPQGGLLEATYRFEVKPDASFNGDYRVFAHLKRDDGTAIWMDDHELPAGQQTSQWKPGQVVEYTRTVFVPAFSYLGPATLEVGLYRDAERLTLETPDPTDREIAEKSYRVAKIELQPRSENIQVFRLNGWHRPEYAADDPTVEWQWTHKIATLNVRNPKRDVTLFLDVDAREDAFAGQPQMVTVHAGDTKLAEFAATNTQTLHRIAVPAAALGTAEMAEFRIEVDRTFVPSKLANGGKDDRELGVRIFHAHVEGR